MLGAKTKPNEVSKPRIIAAVFDGWLLVIYSSIINKKNKLTKSTGFRPELWKVNHKGGWQY